jgi:CheY-like chemotaxis protein
MTTNRPCVLLVDDYEDSLESWRLFLELSGYDVLTARDGYRAVQLASECRPAVVIMDLDLPGITGVEAGRRLRAAPDTRTLPLIAATGYSHGRQLDEAKTVGFDAMILKPCDPTMLLRAIERLIARQTDASTAPASGQSRATYW